MSTLSRYDLLISLIQSELTCTHVLLDSDDPMHNQMLYSKSVESWIFLSEDLMCENAIIVQARNTRITNLLRTISSMSASLVLKVLKKSYDILINHISSKHILTNYLDFKGQFSEEEQPILGYLLSPIKESLIAIIHSQTVLCRGCYKNDATKDMRRAAQYLQFMNKINFVGVGLELSALQDYLSFEDELKNYNSSQADHLLPAISRIITSWLSDWDYDGFASRHGSGSVADTTKDKVAKYLSFATDSKVLDLYQYDLDVVNTVLPFGSLVRQLDRTSKLVFVPKNITKLRSISMEPATLQYLQQGCMRSLYDYFRNHKKLKHILKLQDQSQNKSLAYDGSITNKYATIDLSHASDSVSWDLVCAAFAGVPKLLKWLDCTRSTHTMLPTGERLQLLKFAPMGSALCFPVESLIFAAITQLSIWLSREQALDRDNVTGIRSSNTFFSVYGDDIIIPSYASKMCITLLRSFGFTPNDDKSYLDGSFKESCGGNYWCGFDITPIKFAPSFELQYKNCVSPEAYTALCSYANLAYKRGLRLFRLHCIKTLFKAGIKPYFTDSFDEEPGIFSPTPTNFHLPVVYIKRYQKYQVIYTGVKNVERFPCAELRANVGHIFLYDRLQSFEYNHYDDYIATPGCRCIGNTIITDTLMPYCESTLLPQTFKFTLCKKDYGSP